VDDKSRHVFGTIFFMNGESSDVLIGQLKFTKKQFYSIMTRLVKARLIRRHKGKYFLRLMVLLSMMLIDYSRPPSRTIGSSDLSI